MFGPGHFDQVDGPSGLDEAQLLKPPGLFQRAGGQGGMGGQRRRAIGVDPQMELQRIGKRSAKGNRALDLGGGNMIIQLGVQFATLTASDFVFG